MERRKFTIIVKLVSTLSACLIFALAIISVVQFVQIGSLSRRKEKLEAKLNYLADQKYEIQDAIASQKQVDEAERYAREQLGFIEDGDIVYEVE